MRLKDKVAVVTGSTRGVGAEIAVRYAQEGARVVVTGRTEDRGRAVVEDILASGGKAIWVESDPRHEHSVRGLVNRTLASYGVIDVLVNLAEEQQAVHPMFWCCTYAIPRMTAAGGGSVVNLCPPESTGAVTALARQLATTHRRHRVRVNTIVVEPGDSELEVADLAVYLGSAESASLTGRELGVADRVAEAAHAGSRRRMVG